MDKKEASEIISKKFGKKIDVERVELVGSGYHSNGYKISASNGEAYFIKKIKSFDMGFEFPERKIMSLLIGHSMAQRANIAPKSIGVAVKNKEIEFIPEINENTEIYQIQEYGGEGKSYVSLLEEKKNKSRLDSADKEEINKIIEFIVKIHTIKHPSKDKARLTAVYNDCLRSVIGNPEYLLQLLHAIPEDSLLLKPSEQGKFVALMIENMHYFKGRPERLVALHGDFWGANVFFKKDGKIFVIDYSRMPWGDAGFDIGLWMSQYLFRSHCGNKNYFKELGNYFLDSYMEKTGDKEVKKTMIYSLGLVAAMYASPIWIPGVDSKIRESFFNHVCEILKKKEFFW